MASKVYANGLEIVCKASSGKTIAAFPDTCFTPPQAPPTPPGVPIPYPNTALASSVTKGSKSVKFHSKEVYLKGKSFFKTSAGDEAGCAPKKGLITGKIKGKLYFQAGSMDVKVEGKNVCRNVDITTCNHASMPGNTPPMPHVSSVSPPAASDKDELECGESGEYGELKKKSGKGKYHRDHIPSKAALKKRAETIKGKSLSPEQATAIENAAFAICIPAESHRSISPTYGGRNRALDEGSALMDRDAKDLSAAAKRDIDEMQPHLDAEDAECAEEYRKETEKVLEKSNADYDRFLIDIMRKVK